MDWADRKNFFEFVRTILRDRGSDSNTPLAVLIVDLDRFREVNHAFGHRMGDQLLEELGQRMQGMLRNGDSFARIGDDEFGLVLSEVMNINHATLAAAKIQSMMEEPFVLNEQEVMAKASIGIALFPKHGTNAERLIQHADAALTIAKREGCGFAIYDKESSDSEKSRFSLEAELQEAIGEGELALYYQPKINMQGGRISGAEALVRWNSPKHGFLPPDKFIPLAERTGLIEPLTLWVLNTALRQSAAYAKAGVDLAIAVNLSPCNLRDDDLPELMSRSLETWGANPAHLVLEITENAMMEDPARALQVLKRLSALGVSLSIDDFGSGYSSLAYLQKLPVNELKVDRSFVMNMTEKKDNATIVRSVIELARNFNLATVAEGVEDERTWDMLKNLGCEYAQGYYMSPPLPLQTLNTWIVESPWGFGEEKTKLSNAKSAGG